MRAYRVARHAGLGRKVVDRLAGGKAACDPGQQAEVASGLASGKTVDDLAAKAGVSSNTVRSHVRSVLEKTGAKRQTDVVALMVGLALPPLLLTPHRSTPRPRAPILDLLKSVDFAAETTTTSRGPSAAKRRPASCARSAPGYK